MARGSGTVHRQEVHPGLHRAVHTQRQGGAGSGGGRWGKRAGDPGRGAAQTQRHRVGEVGASEVDRRGARSPRQNRERRRRAGQPQRDDRGRLNREPGRHKDLERKRGHRGRHAELPLLRAGRLARRQHGAVAVQKILLVGPGERPHAVEIH